MVFSKLVCGTCDTIEENIFELKLCAAFKRTFMVVSFFFLGESIQSSYCKIVIILSPYFKKCGFFCRFSDVLCVENSGFFLSSQMSLGCFINYRNTSICSSIVCPVLEKTNS